jgi:hypothetical protein
MPYATQLVLLLSTWRVFEAEIAARIREIFDRRRERLEPFKISDALAAVHQLGIVHRDIQCGTRHQPYSNNR